MSQLLFPSEEIHRRVRQVLERVPAYRPRATLQAYNAFLQKWLVVSLMDGGSIFHADLLALLLLLQYVWPDVFHQISTNPYYFIYLHALATGRANHDCTPSEMEEIKDIGLPLNVRNKNIYPYDDPNLFRLLDVWNFETGLDGVESDDILPLLWSHITFDPTLEKLPIFPDLKEEEVWATLISGDPARIKLLQFYLSELLSRDYEQPLLESILDLNKDINPGNANSEKLANDAEARVFALGLIGNKVETVKIFKEILISSPNLGTNLKLRIIYALERLIKRIGSKREYDVFSSLVQDVLINNESGDEHGQRVRVHVAKLAQYGAFSNSDMRKLTKLLFDNSNENELVRLAFRESWKKASWCEEALSLLSVKNLESMPARDMVEICEYGAWPKMLGKYFVRLAQGPEPDLASRSFAILRNYPNHIDGEQTPSDKVNIISWLGDLLQANECFRKEAWDYIAVLQGDKEVSWSPEVWQELEDFAIKNDDLSIIRVLSDLNRQEARDLLLILREDAPLHWHNSIDDALVD